MWWNPKNMIVGHSGQIEECMLRSLEEYFRMTHNLTRSVTAVYFTSFCVYADFLLLLYKLDNHNLILVLAGLPVSLFFGEVIAMLWLRWYRSIWVDNFLIIFANVWRGRERLDDLPRSTLPFAVYYYMPLAYALNRKSRNQSVRIFEEALSEMRVMLNIWMSNQR